jgi:hypothetical protein
MYSCSSARFINRADTDMQASFIASIRCNFKRRIVQARKKIWSFFPTPI